MTLAQATDSEVPTAPHMGEMRPRVWRVFPAIRLNVGHFNNVLKLVCLLRDRTGVRVLAWRGHVAGGGQLSSHVLKDVYDLQAERRGRLPWTVSSCKGHTYQAEARGCPWGRPGTRQTGTGTDGTPVPLPSPALPQDEYQFCYQAALEYLGSFDHYAT